MIERFWHYAGYPAFLVFGRDSRLYGWIHVKWLRAYVAKQLRLIAG